MCSIKSFIITEKEVYWSKETDSHSDLLEINKLSDNELQPNFVKVEITPPSRDVFAPLGEWEYKVDQDYLPDWYVKEIDEARCRVELQKWANECIFVNKHNFEISEEGVYYLKNCRDVVCRKGMSYHYRDSSSKHYGNSVSEHYDNSSSCHCDNSVSEHYDNSTSCHYDNSVSEHYDNSTSCHYDNSVSEHYDNSTSCHYDNSVSEHYDNSTSEHYGNSIAIILNSYQETCTKEQIALHDNSTLKDCKTKTIYQAGDWGFVNVND